MASNIAGTTKTNHIIMAIDPLKTGNVTEPHGNLTTPSGTLPTCRKYRTKTHHTEMPKTRLQWAIHTTVDIRHDVTVTTAEFQYAVLSQRDDHLPTPRNQFHDRRTDSNP
jgi:hypothetical protein